MSNYEFLGLGNYLVRNLVNKKTPSNKIQELSMQIKKKKKKSPHKEEEEIKYGIPEFRNKRKK